MHGKYRFSYPKSENEKRALRESLLEVRPDILFLQEIGSDAYLLELQMDLKALGLDYPYRFAGNLPEIRSGMGVLSRFPPESVIQHYPVPVETPLWPEGIMPRGFMELSITYAGQTFHFFQVHLKSRYTSNSADPDSVEFRTAEVATLARFLSERMPLLKAFPVLVGDLNTPFSSPVMESLRERWEPVQARDAAGEDWTYLYHKTQNRERIDGFWILQSLDGDVDCSAFIHSGDASSMPSDHRLLLLDFSLP